MEIKLTEVEIDPKYEAESSFLINFRLNLKEDYCLYVCLEKAGWQPVEIFHDYERNENYENCRYCGEDLKKEDGNCKTLSRYYLVEIYNEILVQPKFKLRALYKGLRRIE